MAGTGFLQVLGEDPQGLDALAVGQGLLRFVHVGLEVAAPILVVVQGVVFRASLASLCCDLHMHELDMIN